MKHRFQAHATASKAAGFTLIETLLALSLFAMILAMGYQTIVATAEGRNLVVERADRQQVLRDAHRTLENALSTNALQSGDHHQIEIDLTQANSNWLAGSQQILFSIDQNGQLLAYLQDVHQATLLLDGLEQARFRYFHQGLFMDTWSKQGAPDLVELSWTEGGEFNAWRFRIQQ